jgi:ribosomal protein S14
MGVMNYRRQPTVKGTVNHAKTSFGTGIFADAISVLQYLAPLRCTPSIHGRTLRCAIKGLSTVWSHTGIPYCKDFVRTWSMAQNLITVAQAAAVQREKLMPRKCCVCLCSAATARAVVLTEVAGKHQNVFRTQSMSRACMRDVAQEGSTSGHQCLQMQLNTLHLWNFPRMRAGHQKRIGRTAQL